MTPIKVISNGKGEARAVNPIVPPIMNLTGNTMLDEISRDGFAEDLAQYKTEYDDFERTVKSRPIYKSGKLFLEPGEVSCKVGWLGKCQIEGANWFPLTYNSDALTPEEWEMQGYDIQEVYNVLEPATIEAGKLSNLTVEVEYFGEAGYIAYVKQDKGLLVQGDSVEECLRELATSIEALLSIKKALGHEQ